MRFSRVVSYVVFGSGFRMLFLFRRAACSPGGCAAAAASWRLDAARRHQSGDWKRVDHRCADCSTKSGRTLLTIFGRHVMAMLEKWIKESESETES